MGKQQGLKLGMLGLLLGSSWSLQVWSQDVDQLSQQLDRAVAQSDWEQGILIIDQMIEVRPAWEDRLTTYRNQLVELAGSDFPDLPPLPDPDSGTSSSSTATTPLSSSGRSQNCGGNTNCLLEAASQCQPTQARFTSDIDRDGIQGSGVNTIEIQGSVGGGCRTVTGVESISALDLSGAGIPLGESPDQLSQALLEEFLQGTTTICQYNSGPDLRAVLEVDLGLREGEVGLSEITPTGGALQGPVTLDGRQVAQCQVLLPSQLGGLPFGLGDLF